jgi:hypothetical protein
MNCTITRRARALAYAALVNPARRRYDSDHLPVSVRISY